MIVFKHKGNFKNTENFLSRAKKINYIRILEKYANDGVSALSSATPIDSGETSSSWGFEITQSKGSYSIVWTNSNVVNGIPVVILLQYGHGTKNGGYVQGIDFINPAIRPIFERIAKEAWKEVTS